ncbi:hypothetical protein NMY22_g4115 [Coprinellus aureogranulatus]|nr:hypothetical protein NMY22_g4115 [Coprinellus aureogranulatus]
MSKSEKLKEHISRIFKQDHSEEDSAEGCSKVSINDILPKEDSAEMPSNQVPINDVLPNELLAAIFVFNAERTLSAFKDILAISHTCSQWRETAIDCPELWRSYALMWTIRNKEFADVMLKRCGSLTLDAGWDRVVNPHRFSSSDYNRVVNRETDSIQRLRSYSIVLNSGFLELSEPRWGDVAPTQSIQELVFDSGDRFNYHYTPYTRIVDPDTASLRILRLRSVWIDFSTIRTENLHTFEIALPAHATPWDAQQWVQFIQECPKLTHLSLNLYALPYRDNRAVSKNRRESLPLLSRLAVAAPLSFGCTILNRFDLPSLRALSLTWPEREIDGDIHGIVGRVMVPSIVKAAKSSSAGGVDSTGGRLQISVSDRANKLYIGFTPPNVDLSPPQDWSEYAGEHFGWASSHPNDFIQLRIKKGGWRLGKILPYWTSVARLASVLHTDASSNDAIHSSVVKDFFLIAREEDSYILWDYEFPYSKH